MDLYREELLDYYKNPPNKGKLASFSHTIHETNPLCGDALDLFIEIKDGVVTNASFEGQGCAISLASVSMLLEKVKGMSVDDVKKISRQEVLEQVNPNLTLSRIKCATLGYNALIKLLAR